MENSTSTPTVVGTRPLYEGYPPTYLDFVRFPGGETARYLRIDMGDSAQVLPVNERKEILFVEGYRHGLGRVALTLPAGVTEQGETPRATARRELIEETGHDAKVFRKMLALNTLPGYIEGRMHVFLARGLRRVRTDIDRGEVDRIQFVSVEKAMDLIRRGVLATSTMATILYARERRLL